MPSEKKIDQVKNLTERLKEAKSVVLVDYQGLTHPQLSELRKRLESGGGSLMVTKNTLLKLALKSSTYNGSAELTAEALQPNWSHRHSIYQKRSHSPTKSPG